MVSSRLLKEYRELRSSKRDPEIDLNLVDESDVFVWTAHLQGPPGTPYEGGTFELLIKCPPNYPLVPPKVTFVTHIFHPNVLYTTGEICLDILKPDAWTPAWTLQSVCRAVAALLSHPEADSPLNCDCGDAVHLLPVLPSLTFHLSSLTQNHRLSPSRALQLWKPMCLVIPHRKSNPERRYARIPLHGAHVYSAACHAYI